MSQNKIEETLKHGIYGTPEIKPDERRMYLNTIEERIYLALTKRQVAHKKMYNEAISIMKTNSDVQLLLNGELPYSMYADYIQEANKNKIPFTIVTVDSETPIGLVLASTKALDSTQEIFIKDDLYELE
ncbi:YueI family protein [Anaerobacillus sp. MEB173]|uniref:YueI family protein n=1 Tax=Anaerobacillus sp. MEB173 TaxID=3383345 RepID=UPI003F8DA855